MLRIITHIERLLIVNDCVIVPEFGGFVLQNHTAQYIPSNDTFLPPYKEIVFNITLKHNDGLLAESYMQIYSVDYREAQSMLAKDVADLKKELDLTRFLTLENIGSFTKDKNEIILFQPNRKSSLLNIISYGLSALSATPILKLKSENVIEDSISTAGKVQTDLYGIEEEEYEEQESLFNLPINHFIVRFATISVAAVVLFFLISTPISDVRLSAYTAGFLPPEIKKNHFNSVYEEVVLQNPVDISQQVDNNNSVLVTSEPLKKDVEQPLQAKSEQPQTESDKVMPKASIKVEEEQKQVNQKMYYVIIASFSAEAQANKFIKELDPTSFKNVGIIKHDGRVRVYADKSAEKQVAEQYLSEVKTKDIYKNSWMFIK